MLQSRRVAMVIVGLQITILLHIYSDFLKNSEHLRDIHYTFYDPSQCGSGLWHVLCAVTVHFSHSETQQQWCDTCTITIVNIPPMVPGSQKSQIPDISLLMSTDKGV